MNVENTESHRKRSDDLKSSVSPQQVRGKEPWSNFSDEQLNYFKFALIVMNEFSKALRKMFRTMWDRTFGYIIGFKPWDDSLEVRNLFLMAEGGHTKVPTTCHMKSGPSSPWSTPSSSHDPLPCQIAKVISGHSLNCT